MSLAIFTACAGEGSGAFAPFESSEVCGTLGPHRLLALEPGQFPWTMSVHRDRFIYSVHRDPNGYSGGPFTVYSTDRCGEDRRTLAAGIPVVPLGPEGPLLGVERDLAVDGGRRVNRGTIYEIDPAGERPPRRLLEHLRAMSFTSKGALVTTAAPGEDAVTLFFIPGDSPRPEPRSLGDGFIEGPWVTTDPSKGRGMGPVLAGEAQVLALTSQRDLVAIDLASLMHTAIDHDVSELALSASGRHVIVRHLAPDETPESPVGPRSTTLHDLETGAASDLGVTYSASFLGSLAVLELGEADTLLDPETMTELDLPYGLRPDGVFPDGALFCRLESAILRVSPGSTEPPTVLWAGPGARAPKQLERGLLIEDLVAYPQWGVAPGRESERSLWFVSHTGDASRVLELDGEEAWSAMDLAEGRFLVHSSDGLFLADPNGETQRITRATPGLWWNRADPLVPGAFVYAQVEDAPGIYLAQPAPR